MRTATKNPKMYSVEWKQQQQLDHGGWAQKHPHGWAWHYIQYDTEYQLGGYCDLKRQCEGKW